MAEPLIDLTDEKEICPECKEGTMIDGVCDACGYKKKRTSGAKKKKDNAEIRVDYSSMDNTYSKEYMITPFKTNEDGFMKGKAVITNVGVFSYALPGGQVRRELRPPEEVFHPDSLMSLSMAPLTNDHPSERVTTDNVKKYQVGSLGEFPMRDEYHVSAPIVINDAEAIADVQTGKRGLSAGYSVDLEETPGVWMGVPYDAIQRNIRYNHVAIVDRGRAGDAAKIHMDGLTTQQNAIGVQIQMEDNMSQPILKTINMDGIEYQAEESVLVALNGVKTKLDSTTEELKTAKNDAEEQKAKTIELQAKLDSATEELEELKKDTGVSQEKIDEAVAQKLALITAANKAGVEIKEDMSDLDVKKAVIISVSPNAKSKLDGADEAYVQVRFDVALETLSERDDKDADKKRTVQGSNMSTDSVDTNDDSAESARQKMIQRNADAWKGNKE